MATEEVTTRTATTDAMKKQRSGNKRYLWDEVTKRKNVVQSNGL